jgi:hypothetical protein
MYVDSRDGDGHRAQGKAMSRAVHNRQESARQRIAAQQAEQRARAARRRILVAGGSILAVIAVVVALVLVKTVGSAGAPNPAAGQTATGTALPASVAAEVTTVPAATLNQVGAGAAAASSITRVTSGAALTSGGKPEILYIGAEYCPYCATERWPLAVALSRFGTFSGLHGIHSSSTDAYPSQPTLTFYGSAYTSKYLTFEPVETTTENPAVTLQQPSAAQQAVLRQYDAPPYVPAGDAGVIPFLDIGNRYLINGAQFNPQVLQGLTWAQVAAALNNPSSPVAQGADGAANMITAAICQATGNQPASVCASPMIAHLEGQL